MLPTILVFTCCYCKRKSDREDTGYSFVYSVIFALLTLIVCYLIGEISCFLFHKETIHKLYDMNEGAFREEHLSEFNPEYIKGKENTSILGDNASITYMIDGEDGEKKTVTVPKDKAIIKQGKDIEEACVKENKLKINGLWQIVLLPFDKTQYIFYLPYLPNPEDTEVQTTEENDTDKPQGQFSFLID